MPRTRPILIQKTRTNPLIWLVGIVCAVLAIVVIIAAIVTFTIYMIYQPKKPNFWVPYTHLNNLDYSQSGLLAVEMAINIEADNDNRKADASFSNIGFILQFHGQVIAALGAEPFDVAKLSSFSLNYTVPSSPIPLDSGGMAEVDAALKQDKVQFNLDGQALTRWRVGVFPLRSWAHLSCRLQFSPANHSSLGIDCSTKAH